MKNPAWLILPLFLISYSLAEGYTGNDWRSLTKAEQSFYIAGVIDAWEQVVANDERTNQNTVIAGPYKLLTDCVTSKKMRYKQIVPIVKKYMDQHREEWRMGMSAIVWSAIYSRCSQTE